MSNGESWPTPVDPGKDSYLDMAVRRAINDFAEHPVDFNMMGLEKAAAFTELTEADHILDIGTSSGKFAIEALQRVGIPARLIGLDTQVDAYQNYLGRKIDRSQFSFIRADGQSIPLHDNSVQVTTAHNSLFRASDPIRMLKEFKRVTKPGGLVIISTNARDHADARHFFEREITRHVARVTGLSLVPPPPPAHNAYLEDLPELTRAVGGLQQIDAYTQTDTALVTRERLDVFLTSLKYSANYTNLPIDLRDVWRQTVDQLIAPQIDAVISQQEREQPSHPSPHAQTEPHYADTIHRGLVVYRNVKQAAVRSLKSA